MPASTVAAASVTPRARRGADLAALPAPVRLTAWLAVAVAVQLLRGSGTPAWASIWAEDGTVFLQEALTSSTLEALTTPYSGYLQIPSRLLAEAATLLPLEWAAMVFAVSSALVVALLGAYVWCAARRLLPSATARGLVVALMVFAPPTAAELAGTTTNLHWYGLVATFWALLHLPATRRGAVAAGAVAGMTALNDPLVALLLPLAFLRPGGLRAGGARALAAPAALAVGLALQALAILLTKAPEAQSAFHAADLPGIYAQRVAGGALVGESMFGTAWEAAGWVAAWSALALLAGLVGYAIATLRGAQRRLAIVAAAASVVLFAAPLAVRGTVNLLREPGEVASIGIRYMYAPLVLVWIPLAALVDATRAPLARRLAVLAMVMVLLPTTVQATERGDSASWGPELQTARARCAGSAAEARVAIAPADRRWLVRFPCRAL